MYNNGINQCNAKCYAVCFCEVMIIKKQELAQSELIIIN